MAGLSSLLYRFGLVRQIPIFSKLNWFEIRRIARKAIIEEYKKGDIIRKAGDPADFFYCLVSGRLQSYTINHLNQKDNVEFIHRGMHFGIISAFTGESHSQNFEAINDSIILKISRDDFHAILKNIPSLAIEFGQSLSRRVRGHVQGVRSDFESTIISIYSPMMGTGSSTYAINLALSLEKETKKKVILVKIHAKRNDINAGHARDSISSYFENSIELRNLVADHDQVFKSIIKEGSKVHFLNVVFDAQDITLKKQISPLVSTLVGNYHYVIVDLPNDMDDSVLETLTQSDAVHLITMDRRKDLELIRKVIDRLEQTFKERFNADKIRIILRGIHDQVYLSYEEINRTIDFNVYTMLPNIASSEIKGEIIAPGISIPQIDESSQYMLAVKRIARQIGGVMVGLVLGGGAALGVAHVGVIRVLEQENIPIDIIVGSSMGALVGAIWAVGKNADEIEAVAREFEKKKDLGKLWDLANPFKALVGGTAIKRWLRTHLGNSNFHDTKIPFKAIAYDLTRREELIIDEGNLVDAVRKSIAIPGVIAPVEENERVIIDGGVLNPLPTNVLVNLGVKRIIAVNVLQTPAEVSDGFDMMHHKLKQQEAIPFSKAPFQYTGFRLGAFLGKAYTPNIADMIVRTLQACEYVIAEQSAHQANVVIHPHLVGIHWFELYRVDDLIKSGEEATRKVLPAIKKLIE